MKRSLKKDFIWNMLGSVMQAACTAVLAFLVMRIAGEEEGGIFGFGYSTFGQHLFIISYFGIRAFQATDVKEEYSFREYRKARVITSLAAVAAALLWIGILVYSGTYTEGKGIILLFLGLTKISDGVADLYETECQRKGVFWRGGREMFLRFFLLAVLFPAVLILSGSLLDASAAGLIVTLLVTGCFAGRLKREGITGSSEKPGKTAGNLLSETWLLFAGVFLDFYVFSGVKYAVDLFLGDSASGIFNVLFMPTSVIYMVANLIIRPCLGPLSEAVTSGNTGEYDRIRKKLSVTALVLSAAALLLTALLGKTVLGIFELLLGEAYEGKLTCYAGEFFLIILGGCFYTAACLNYYCLVTKRKQKIIFMVYLVTALITLLTAGRAVKALDLTGAAMIYAVLMSILAFGMKLGERLG